MATRKPEPSPPNYPYDPLPSSPDSNDQQQTQYYVVLPFYSPSGRRRRWALSCRRYISCAITALLLTGSLYFLWPSDPYLKVVRLRLDRLKIHAKPKISIDITLAVTMMVRNPDVFSLDYKSLNVSVGYRGEQLGFVTSNHGHVRAFGSSYVNATLVLDGVEVLSDAILLIEDLAKGLVPLTTVSEIRGTLGLFFIHLPLKAKISCDILMNTHNQTIERQDCYPQ